MNMPDMRRPLPRVPNPKVVVTRELSDDVMARMEQLFDASLNRDDTPYSRDRLVAAVQEAVTAVEVVGSRGGGLRVLWGCEACGVRLAVARG